MTDYVKLANLTPYTINVEYQPEPGLPAFPSGTFTQVSLSVAPGTGTQELIEADSRTGYYFYSGADIAAFNTDIGIKAGTTYYANLVINIGGQVVTLQLALLGGSSSANDIWGGSKSATWDSPWYSGMENQPDIPIWPSTNVPSEWPVTIDNVVYSLYMTFSGTNLDLENPTFYIGVPALVFMICDSATATANFTKTD